jgi:predicted nucleotidyltransferase
MDTLRAERREEILRLAERRGALNLRVFGSVARGEANEHSDLDLLVAWEPGRSLMDHAGLVQGLQELLGMRSTSEPRSRFIGTCATGSFARRCRCEG